MKTYTQSFRPFVAILVTIAFAVSACTGEEPAPDPTELPPTATTAPPTEPPPTEPPPPTDTPTPTATPEPTATPDPTAGFEEFVDEDLGIALKIPAGWAADSSFGSLVIGSSQELVDVAEPDDEGAILLVLVEDAEAFPSADPQESLADLLEDIASGEDITRVGDPEPINIGDVAGALAEIESNEDGDIPPLSGFVAILQDEARGVTIIGATAQANADEFLPTLYAILDTIVLTEPVVVEAGGQNAAVGETVTGSVDSSQTSTPFSFEGTAGDIVTITVEPLENELDVAVQVFDDQEESILVQETDRAFGTEELTEVILGSTGTFTVLVRALDGSGEVAVTVTQVATLPAGETLVGLGNATDGTLDGDETLRFAFVAKAGDLVGATVIPETEGLDVVIDIVDADGFSILPDGELDDSFDVEYLRLIPVDASGYYFLTVRSLDGTAGDFSAVLELANDGLPGAIVILDDVLEGGFSHEFPFTAEAGDVVTLIVDPDPTLDVVVGIYSEDGDELIEEVDASTGFEELRFTAPAAGDYYFQVTSFEDTVGEYVAYLLGPETTILEVIANDIITGRFGPTGILSFYYAGAAGEVLEIEAMPDEDTDVVIRLLDLDGEILAEVDEELTGSSELLSYTFEAEDLVIIEVEDFFFGEGSVELLLFSE